MNKWNIKQSKMKFYLCTIKIDSCESKGNPLLASKQTRKLSAIIQNNVFVLLCQMYQMPHKVWCSLNAKTGQWNLNGSQEMTITALPQVMGSHSTCNSLCITTHTQNTQHESILGGNRCVNYSFGNNDWIFRYPIPNWFYWWISSCCTYF